MDYHDKYLKYKNKYLQLRKKNNNLQNIQNQINNSTRENHYPLLHKYIKSKYSPLKVLSFGSSDGSEVNDLKKSFPNSIIHGLEIKKELVDTCNAKNKNIMFYHDIGDLELKTYDLILCNSVLCRWPDKKEYTFEIFQKTIRQIDSLLNDNGIFILVNAKFLFTETDVFKNYTIENVNTNLLFKKADQNHPFSHNWNPLSALSSLDNGITWHVVGYGKDWMPKYHKDGTPVTTKTPVIFRKY